MASLAQDRISGQEGPGRAGRGKASKAPLSTHPAFPFIVGLWFAALLGIGSLVVPVPVIERLVEMTGLASIVPQTAPPLGFTARALIALACTVGGGLLGLLIARKVGQAHRKQVATMDRGQMAARRPISAHDELGADGFDGPAANGAPRGRRALAIVDEESPSEVFELAPLPGKSLPLSALDLAEVEALELADVEMIDGEAEVAEPGFSTLADAAASEDLPTGDFSMADRRHFKLDTFGQTVGAPIQPRQQFILDPAPPQAQEPEVEAAEAGPAAEVLPEVEPVADLHFSPPSLARPFATPEPQPGLGPDHTEEAEMDDFATPAGPEPVPAMPQAAANGADWQESELEDLALVQLAQRLGSSIARRREQRAAAAAAASVSPVAIQAATMPAVLTEDFDVAEATEAAQAMAAYFGGAARQAPEPEAAPEPQAEPEAAFRPAPAPAPEAPHQPAAVLAPLVDPATAPAAPPAGRQVFRPVEPDLAPHPAPLANLAQIDLGEDDEDEDDHVAHLTASFSLPLARQFSTDTDPAPAADEAEMIVAPAPAPSLAPAPSPAPFANPFQQRAPQFVRIEDEPQPEDGAIEPAVVFPGEARAATGTGPAQASAEENERALREALLGLQRMSGVA